MSKKRYSAEEIVAKLRQVDVLTSQGQSVADAVRAIGVTEVTYYRWRQEYGGLKTNQVRRMKELELENQRLRKAVADLTLDKQILAEAARGNFQSPHADAPVSSILEPS
jgi:transposase-like protein